MQSIKIQEEGNGDIFHTRGQMPPYPLNETLYPLLYNALLLVNICGKVGCSYCCVNCYCCRSGNAAVVKAGETAIATSNLLAELIPKYLDNVSFPQHFNCKKIKFHTKS